MKNDDETGPIQKDKFDLQEGDIEWITPVGTETPPWVYPTTSLSDVMDFLGVPEEYRRDRARLMMTLPNWSNAPRHINDEAIRLVGDGDLPL
ncbi:hypothetical protein [Nocardiopsis sp. HUAS JQ3]|uniref:hypothetical protein n=1 Tax=Nocardiopsis sp. HUAS JQ3 TaxID=3061629 RepID=UPI0023A924AD|nr:hypothetical protein [Nocardiopsis sp. HUAS JQ3]WDZ91199.1 hypothetical protein PV789_01060 [Nocardiopsis sp. HUAS JQ3]